MRVWETSEGHLGTGLEGQSEGQSGGQSGSFWDPIWTLSEKPHKIAVFHLHLAVGRALRLNMTNNGVLGGSWLGTGIAPPRPTLVPIPRVHPSPTPMLPATPLAPGTTGIKWSWGSNR